MEATNAEHMAKENRKVILSTLKSSGPLSRAEISRKVGLSFPSVSSNVNFLIDEGYVREVGEGNNALGRKSTLLEFNAKKGCVLGIDLGRYKVNMAIADLLGNTDFFLSREIKNHGVIVPSLREIIEEGLTRSSIDLQNVCSICIGTPGVINDNEDRIILAPFAEELSKDRILKEVKKYFDCPVTIENSVNLGAIGEKWKGCGVGYKNIIYINYGIGIGSALILNNNLYTGTNGIAGEIGFLPISPDSVYHKYNDAGALEELISGHSLDDKVTKSQLGILSMKELFSLKTTESQILQDQILKDIKKYFGVVLLNITSILNPQVIILSGGIGINIGKLLISEWEETLKTNIPFIPKILISEIDSKANVYGAIRYALRNIEDAYCVLD